MNATHSQYEALRAYFVDKVPSKEVAERFGYTSGSFRVLCHHFRADPSRALFLPERTRAVAAEQPGTKTSRLQERVVACCRLRCLTMSRPRSMVTGRLVGDAVGGTTERPKVSGD